eukprot:TRINITY_DN70199_c0_g1_i1.p1 TRINITY_DN70199_c0_g1~~TRINITY_DN70199_c0_g1_i1.p1  ORF type:complete len:415 (+),score=119.12 TRINITY_DN70199_c0_g1_i1:87-1247(+)
MLRQQQETIDAQQQLELLGLHEREMQLVRDDFNAIATTAALLAGFAFTGAADIDVPEGTDPDVKKVFYVCISLCMVLMVYCVTTSTICVVLGPDMLINGARASATPREVACVVSRATGGMRLARVPIFASFMSGLVLMLVATCLVTMSKVGFEGEANKTGASFVIVIFGIGIIAIVITVTGMYKIFDANPDALYASRRLMPSAACSVCGSISREGMSAPSRRFWLPRACQACWQGSFKCYQCVGQRHDRDRPESDVMQRSAGKVEKAAAGAESGGCCGKPPSAAAGAGRGRGANPGSDWAAQDYESQQRREEGGFNDGEFFVVDRMPGVQTRPVPGTTAPANSPADGRQGLVRENSWVMVEPPPFAGPGRQRGPTETLHHAQFLQR